MTTIKLTTVIQAPIEKCFDLSRDIDLHQRSTAMTNEKAIAGRTSGLCELGDEITWEANHFSIKQQLKVRISKMSVPDFFEDTMLKGAFKSMRHEHHFEREGKNTVMKDVFMYEVPFGVVGQLFNKILLKSYMTKFLLIRNKFIKDCAEQS